MSWGFGEEKTPFNQAALLMERLNGLMEKANEARRVNDIFGWYSLLASIRTSISFIVSDTEGIGTKSKLTIIGNNLSQAREFNDKVTIINTGRLLDDVEETLVKLMYKYGVYYPKDEKVDWVQVAKEEDV